MAKLKYVSSFTDNRGTTRYRFRRGAVSCYFKSFPGTVDFENEYRSLISGAPLSELKFKRRRLPAPTQGGVYFIAAGQNRIKIGWARNVRRRLKELQIGSHVRLSLLAAIPGGRQREAELHERFEHLRVRGEWFRADPELTAYIEEEKSRTCLAHLSSSAGARR